MDASDQLLVVAREVKYPVLNVLDNFKCASGICYTGLEDPSATRPDRDGLRTAIPFSP